MRFGKNKILFLVSKTAVHESSIRILLL